MDKPERFSNGEAMRWNEDVERRRSEYHEQRCAENVLYRSAYERQQEMRRRIQRQACEALTQITDAMHTDCMQRANSITEDGRCQQVKTQEDVMRERALVDSMSRSPTEWFSHSTGFGLGFAVATMMFADHGKMQQRMKEIEEERPYLEEIRKADEEFDREIIHLSGFEW